MAIGQRHQTNTMLYTVITFVALFIVAASVAVIYYLQAEKLRTNAAASQSQLNEMATPGEQRIGMGKIVGSKQSRESYLGKMVDYLDRATSLIIGGIPEDTTAEVKIDTVNRFVTETLNPLVQQYPDIQSSDPNTTGLTQIIKKLKIRLDNTSAEIIALNGQLKDLQNRFDDAVAASFEKEKTLLSEKEKYQKQVDEIQTNYNELKALMEQTSEQQVKILAAQLNDEKVNSKQLKDQLLKTDATLKMAEDRTAFLQKKIQGTMPVPDMEVMAFKPDGKIILIDEQARIVHLNIGSDNHVYPGLTFSVYDKSIPIPKDGKGKAEIEVFDVAKTFSAARIIYSERKNPVIQDDIVVNLIWDSDKTTMFVVAGEFDLDGNGQVDTDADEKIKSLIEKWGGKVTDNVSVNTDFVILGEPPRIRVKPSREQLEVDPLATEKYEASLQKLAHYKEIQSQAQTLSVPVFGIERFLYFIGYKAKATSAGAW